MNITSDHGVVLIGFEDKGFCITNNCIDNQRLPIHGTVIVDIVSKILLPLDKKISEVVKRYFYCMATHRHRALSEIPPACL